MKRERGSLVHAMLRQATAIFAKDCEAIGSSPSKVLITDQAESLGYGSSTKLPCFSSSFSPV